jgi:hypothetical protein
MKRYGFLFTGIKEEEIYDKTKKHIENTVRGTIFLRDAIDDLCNEKYDKMEEIADEIIKLERESDKIARDITRRIIEVIKDPSDREDLIKFIQSLERVTKAVEASAYRIDMSEGVRIPEILKKDLIGLIDAVIKTTQSCEKTIAQMPFYIEDALKHVEGISNLEEDVDNIRRTLMKDLIKVGGDIHLTDFYLLTEIVEKLEEIADLCEYACTVMEIIIASK